MRVLVCGGRDFGNVTDIPSNLPGDDYERLRVEREFQFVWDYLIRFFRENNLGFNQEPVSTLIYGCASGVDTIAANCAQGILMIEPYPANWKKHGKAAGPIRNQHMLDEGKPDLVIAFPGGRGTADMVARARKAGVKVVEVTYDKS